jgi:pimeloyl-ACP methyl ester carboxylesterase
MIWICGILYVLVCAGCAGFQRRLIYFPPKFDAATADRNGPLARMERWTNASGMSIGWKRLSPNQPARGRIMITYGNGSCALGCAHYADAIQQAVPLDVYALEYPGYADRAGSPSEKSLETAANEGLESLAANGPVYLAGESLGTGVAAYLAGAYPAKVAGVALLAPYNSLTSVAQYHMPLLPVHLMLCDRFPSEKFLRAYHGPVAVLVGGADKVVPMKFGRKLYDGYDGPKRIWEFPEAGHGNLMDQPPEVWAEIMSFLLTRGKPVPGQ